MTPQDTTNQDTAQKANVREDGSEQSVSQYDAHIVPAEVAARKEREGKHFSHTTQVDSKGNESDSTSGYTVDREGILNNYAIEPEMYVNEPGDLRQSKTKE